MATERALIRAENEQGLLERICSILVEVGGYRMSWVGYAENDPEKTVRPIAFAGHEDGYLQNAKITWADTKRGRGPTGTAIRTGVPCSRKVTDPAFAPWRAEAEKRGYALSIAIPLKRESVTFGAIHAYSDDIASFDEEESGLLTQLADDLAFGISTLRERARAKEAERAVRENERFLVDVFASIKDGLSVVDRDHNVIRANPTIEKLFAHTRPLVGKKCYEVYHQRSTSCSGCPLETFPETGERVIREMPLIGADGRPAGTIEVHSFPLKDKATGKVAAMIEYMRDVTELKRAEAEIRHLSSFPRLDPAPVLEVGRDGRVVFHNPATVDALRRLRLDEDPNLFVPEDIVDILALTDGPVGKSLLREKMVGNAVFEEYIHLVPEFGTARIYARDVTARVRAEEALRYSEARFRTAFEHAGVGINLTGMDGRILKANRRMGEMLGYAEMELAGMDVRDLTHPEDVEYTSEAIRRILADGVPAVALEKRYIHKNGRIIWVSLTSAAVREASGSPLHMITIIEDVTARKLAEEEKARAEAKLQQARRMEAVAGLASEVAFNLINVLAGIQTNVDFAFLKIAEDSPAKDDLNEARRQCERAAGVMQQLLILSQNKQPNLKVLSVNKNVAEMFRILAALTGETYVTNAVLADDLPNVIADPRHMDLVVTNLVSVAKDALPLGGEIEAETRAVEVDAEYARARADARPGTFVRLGVSLRAPTRDAEVLSAYDGAVNESSLALTVVQGIARQHHGWFEVNHHEKGRAEIAVYFPVAPDQPRKAAEKPAVPADRQDKDGHLFGRRDFRIVGDE